jgi:hypothetical protein
VRLVVIAVEIEDSSELAIERDGNGDVTLGTWTILSERRSSGAALLNSKLLGASTVAPGR